MEDVSEQKLLKKTVFVKDGEAVHIDRAVCVEDRVSIFLNGGHTASLIVSPGEYEELGAGFVITQGLCSRFDSVRLEGRNIMVAGDETRTIPVSTIESGGGLFSSASGRTIDSGITIGIPDIFVVLSSIVSELWERTGGAHCSVLFSDGGLIAKSSDVGRHNTVDKVVGRAIIDGIRLGNCILGCTGRQPEGMIAKAVNAGIPIVITKAATTDRGIELAVRSGLTLITRVREGSFEVHSRPDRIRGL